MQQIIPSNLTANQQKVEAPLEEKDQLANITKLVENKLVDSFNQLVENINEIKLEQNQNQKANKEVEKEQQTQLQGNKQTEEQRDQIKQGAQNQDGEEQRQNINEGEQEEISAIEQIRNKQRELILQLEKLKARQQQLLLKKQKNQKIVNSSSITQYNQAEQNPTSQNIEEDQQPIHYTTANKTLSPIKSRRRYIRPKPKPKYVIPEPIIPEMSRQQFEQKVNQIAMTIRAKVNKTNPLVKQKQKTPIHKYLSKSSQKKQKYTIIQLPQIASSKKDKNAKINQFITGLEIQLTDNDSPITKSKVNQFNLEKQMKKIVLGIVKKAFQKITYNQKYGVKLDPVKHHKYPMTTFRKKIIQQKREIQRQKYATQMLRQSSLNQRRQIFSKSRYK